MLFTRCNLDAKSVAVQYNFPHFTIDFTENFKEAVIENFIDEYLHGRTPNPCIVCNREVKWGDLIEEAKKLGAYYIATGHYAKILYDDNTKRYRLKSDFMNRKDQAYALWGLTQEFLARTIFPLEDLTKEEVRELAKEFKIRPANKPESQEICFVADNDYGRFLKEKFEERQIEIPKGSFIYHGRKVGEHKGIPFYTIGQRRGIEVALGKPVYVKSISLNDNLIQLGDAEELICKRFSMNKINYVSVPEVKVGDEVFVKVRYSDKPGKARVNSIDEDLIVLDLIDEKRAVTPGQSSVLYDEEGFLLVGGIILKDLTYET
jgi:Predicted tRNA(5-methylaminomethyl-2-thiouridylate) methyltransferase, contains the PP-loop ATPase domain